MRINNTVSGKNRINCARILILIVLFTAVMAAVSPREIYADTREVLPLYRVQVERNYLALRSEPALERENEIGKLYTGYIVAVLDTSDPQYWMVYSWNLLKYGYVNKDYLVENSAEPEDAAPHTEDIPLNITNDSRVHFTELSGNQLGVSVEVKNLTENKKVVAFEMLVYAHDEYGNLIMDGDRYIFSSITEGMITPGNTAFSECVPLCDGDEIETVFFMVGRVWFSDGTMWEWPEFSPDNIFSINPYD